MKIIVISLSVKYFNNGIISFEKVKLSEEEYAKYLNRDFPITDENGYFIWLDENDFYHRDGNKPAWSGKLGDFYYVHGKPHRIDGPSFDYHDGCGVYYHLNGVCYLKEEFEKATLKRPYFLREKIITLQKLLEIPELYDEVYYAQKSKFISLMKKL